MLTSALDLEFEPKSKGVTERHIKRRGVGLPKEDRLLNAFQPAGGCRDITDVLGIHGAKEKKRTRPVSRKKPINRIREYWDDPHPLDMLIENDSDVEREPRPNGGPAKRSNDPPRWRPYASYTSGDLRALVFRTVAELDRAIELCWSDSILKGLPRFSPDGSTLIVPAEAVEYFRRAGVELSVHDVFKPADLPIDDLAAMRQEYGM
jgi:hypothetical protein